MDDERLKQLRRKLTLHFAVIAWLTAMLVATGSGGYFLPGLVFVVSLGGFIFVDTLGWFQLGKLGSYISMFLVTCFAIGSYAISVWVTESEEGKLLAIAGLLVYPECVLFLQRKSLRVYEQLAIFLLLEMVVAALINDNLFFGLLLTPIMLLWVSSLFLFSRYATLVHIDPSIDTPVPILAEWLYQRFVKPMLGETVKQKVLSSKFIALPEVQSSNLAKRSMQGLPIGVGALAFAAIFFYLLPRTSPGVFQAGLGLRSQVGLPTELRMGLFGRLLQDPTPVMRVSLTSLTTGQDYMLHEPPYLRARVFDAYFPAQSRGSRREYPVWGATGSNPFHPKLQSVNAVTAFAQQGGSDLVVAEFDIRREFAAMLFAIPPAFAPATAQRIDLNYDRFNMLLDPVDPSSAAVGKSLIYRIGSAGFDQNRQLPISPAYLPKAWVRTVVDQLSAPVGNLLQVDDYRRDLLVREGVDESDTYSVAKAYERHFVNSGRFTYTLDLRPPRDSEIDPIEDFIINQPEGHCQYFAAGMVAMLRQSHIPSRIVVGYRPTEFNRFGYFPVKQSDAHAWVEVLFSRAQLQRTELAHWLTDEDTHYWVRFDPTPGGDGGAVEIVEQRGQTIDYAEKLWKDYVVDAQRLSGENNIYAPVSENSEKAYEGLVEKLKNLRTNIESGRLFGGVNGIGFAWPLAIATIVLGCMAVGTWQVVVNLPRWAPNLASRLGLDRRKQYQVKQVFFARCLQLLEKRGLRRVASETPHEFTTAAAAQLEKNASDVGPALGYLTQLYYRLRFGAPSSITREDAQAIDEALRKLESLN